MKLDPREEDLLVDLMARASGDQLMAGIVRRVDAKTTRLDTGEVRVMFRLPVREVPRKLPGWVERHAPRSGRSGGVRDYLGEERGV